MIPFANEYVSENLAGWELPRFITLSLLKVWVNTMNPNFYINSITQELSKILDFIDFIGIQPNEMFSFVVKKIYTK